MKKENEFNRWEIAYRIKSGERFQIINNPSWAWCADPFLVEYQGEIYLFAEAYLYKTERNGVIAYCKFDGEKFGEWIVTMDEHWHLSYPNVFTKDGELYMCPESYQRGDVALYRLVSFPNNWVRTEVLLDNVKYVDSTFIEYGNSEYMFTFAPKFKDAEGQLLAFEKKGGIYRKLAELSDDKTVARCGGNFLNKNGKLIRVAQNSKELYGQGLVFMEITSWFPNYQEKKICDILPKDIPIDNCEKYCGIHTYNRIGDLEVIDLKYIVEDEEEKKAQQRVRKVFTNKYRASVE